MHEIATLKGKKLPELQEIAKNIGIRRITGLKKMELIYQIIDTVAASPVDEKDSSPSPKPQPDKAVGVRKKVHEKPVEEKPAEEKPKPAPTEKRNEAREHPKQKHNNNQHQNGKHNHQKRKKEHHEVNHNRDNRNRYREPDFEFEGIISTEKPFLNMGIWIQ